MEESHYKVAKGIKWLWPHCGSQLASKESVVLFFPDTVSFVVFMAASRAARMSSELVTGLRR
ncbi:hypothetical protein E2C01_060816 [Portunus trituberculatus]|uniref:Uncharacterized protein n=1 Tax=Portunus trituberculatus TaxID=210409 RepID=A0A5B7HAH8_PORTR|nr:hypothetical protein [Portunus trituberculatus]